MSLLFFRRSVLTLLPALLMLGNAHANSAAGVQGAGASFPAKVYQRWAGQFEDSTKIKVAYRASGSSEGVKLASERKVMFGATDTPLSASELAKLRLVQMPTVVGGVVPVVKLPGVGNHQLQLSGELLADLMSGKVARWNDGRIAALNPGLRLPDLPVKRVVRSDESGSTEAFAAYLGLMSASFKAEVGGGKLPRWPGSLLSAEGNDGVVRVLSSTEGGLAYVSFDRVGKDQLSAVRLRNAAGKFVAASEAGFRSAIRESDVHRKGDDSASLLNQAGDESWPITQASFVLLDAEPARAADVAPAMQFLTWSYQRGDRLLAGTGFAPLPLAVKAKLTGRLMQIKPKDGEPLHFLPL